MCNFQNIRWRYFITTISPYCVNEACTKAPFVAEIESMNGPNGMGPLPPRLHCLTCRQQKLTHPVIWCCPLRSPASHLVTSWFQWTSIKKGQQGLLELILNSDMSLLFLCSAPVPTLSKLSQKIWFTNMGSSLTSLGPRVTLYRFNHWGMFGTHWS